MAKTHDAAKTWSATYRLLTSVILSVSDEVAQLGLEVKDLFLLSEVDAHPHPAELAVALLMPKPTVTVVLKRLEAAGFVRREIDATDLRRHRIQLTAGGRKAMNRGMALLSEGFAGRLRRLSPLERKKFEGMLERLTS